MFTFARHILRRHIRDDGRREEAGNLKRALSLLLHNVNDPYDDIHITKMICLKNVFYLYANDVIIFSERKIHANVHECFISHT